MIHRRVLHAVLTLLSMSVGVCLASVLGVAQDPANAVCPRFAEGAAVANPPDLYSHDGVLEATLRLRQVLDSNGLMRYCYVTDHGAVAPTLHVQPGDKLLLHFKNELAPSATPVTHVHATNGAALGCNGGAMNASSSNIHFHGTTLPPVCHQDEVLNTVIQPSQSFDYSFTIPKNESPGLYWYHPHPHGFTELQVQGGASGALIVEGIERVYPELAVLPQRMIVLRDQKLDTEMSAAKDVNKPTWDLSLNYVPVRYPKYAPATIETRPKQREFWRVLNAAADALLDVQVVINNVPQPLHVYAVDGVPLPANGNPVVQETIHVAPGARVEFTLTTPDIGETAQLITRKHDTGPAGDTDPERPIANLVANANAPYPAPTKELHAHDAPPVSSFAGLASVKPVASRGLVFAEENSKDDAHTIFFIATDPGMHARFHFDDPPKFKVRQGTVEEWRVQNQAKEDHTFHIHQLHFQVIKINGQPVDDPAIRDTVTLPYWTGKGPYPSVTLLMDFRDPNIIGTFPFHCHILAHEDAGMMAKLQVLPPAQTTQITLSVSPAQPQPGVPVVFTAHLSKWINDPAAEGFIEFHIDGAGHPIVGFENGVATYTTTFRTAGSHKIRATYSGDDVYGPAATAETELTIKRSN